MTFSPQQDREQATTPRKGSPDPTLDEAEFRRRFLKQFTDPAFDSLGGELDGIVAAAWDAYSHHRKSPHTRKAGPDFEDADYDLSVDWIAARDAIQKAQQRQQDMSARPRILLISGSPRSEHTCPGEVSKSHRLIAVAREVLEAAGAETEVLDLARTTSEFGISIHPCKACFSTSPALCHWPCSCYPNHSLGQSHDWMNDIYPMWAAAHGVMIITPVHWYQAPSPLKLMLDRLVCADGGSPDPTRTHGKDARRAKEIELDGWDYPRHLAGRSFSVVVHGDAEGAENVRRSLSDWLSSMGLISAGPRAELDRYIGYWKPYASNHVELDQDPAFQEEVRNAARTLLEAIGLQRMGRQMPGESLNSPRDK